MRLLAHAGIDRATAVQLGGQFTQSGANITFTEGTEGFAKLLPQNLVKMPAPRERKFLADLPAEEQNIAAEVLSLVKDESTGLGDTLEKAIHAIGVDRAAKLYERLTGKSCGCDGRKKWLNKFWPYRT